MNGQKASQEFDGRKTSNGRKMSQEVSSGRKMSQEIGSGRKMSQELNGMEGTEVMAVLNAPASEKFLIVIICDLSNLEKLPRDHCFLLRNHSLLYYMGVFVSSESSLTATSQCSLFALSFHLSSHIFFLSFYPPESCFACRKPVLPEDGCSALGRSYHQVR